MSNIIHSGEFMDFDSILQLFNFAVILGVGMLGFRFEVKGDESQLKIAMYGLGSIALGIVFGLLRASLEIGSGATVMGVLTFSNDHLSRSSLWVAVGFGLLLLAGIRMIRRALRAKVNG